MWHGFIRTQLEPEMLEEPGKEEKKLDHGQTFSNARPFSNEKGNQPLVPLKFPIRRKESLRSEVVWVHPVFFVLEHVVQVGQKKCPFRKTVALKFNVLQTLMQQSEGNHGGESHDFRHRRLHVWHSKNRLNYQTSSPLVIYLYNAHTFHDPQYLGCVTVQFRRRFRGALWPAYPATWRDTGGPSQAMNSSYLSQQRRGRSKCSANSSLDINILI